MALQSTSALYLAPGAQESTATTTVDTALHLEPGVQECTAPTTDAPPDMLKRTMALQSTSALYLEPGAQESTALHLEPGVQECTAPTTDSIFNSDDVETFIREIEKVR